MFIRLYFDCRHNELIFKRGALVLKDFIEFFFSIGLVVNTFLYVPQIFRLTNTKHANDISLITFAGFNLTSFFTCLHALLTGDKWLMIGYAFTCAANTLVTALIIKYRFFNKSH